MAVCSQVQKKHTHPYLEGVSYPTDLHSLLVEPWDGRGGLGWKRNFPLGRWEGLLWVEHCCHLLGTGGRAR